MRELFMMPGPQLENTLQVLRNLHDATRALSGAPGPRALYRRLSEILHGQFHVNEFECARISKVRGRVQLKRRQLSVPGIKSLSDDTLEKLGTLLSAANLGTAELRDGCALLRVDTKDIFVAISDDPRSRNGTILAWELPTTSTIDLELQKIALDQILRTVQNEARWLRKLDRTQAQLYRDDLTGLYNYRFLEIALDNELRRADRFQTPFCLLFIDLDSFKPINDEHGHCSGSAVLKQVADVLREAVREIDIAIRYGGDEFVVLLLGATSAKGLLVAERVRRLIEAFPFLLDDGSRAHLTASIGVAAYPEHAKDRATLLRLADESMYSSKRSGKNRVSVVSSISKDEENIAR